MNTRGYGGRTLSKGATVTTNDKALSTVRLSISGPVERFADISPPRVVLRGMAGDQVQQTVTITPQKKYPFKIVSSRAQTGTDFTFNLDEDSTAQPPGYRLTVSNRRTREGRYSDTIFLQTDSPAQPQIAIRVNGHLQKPTIADVKPTRAFLMGPAGRPLKAVVRVAPKPGHTLKITQAVAESGKHISLTLTESGEGEKAVYQLAIENTKKDKGRYRDIILLKTDSAIQPEITVPVSGNIN